jgi:hypothetical protein
MKKILVGLLAIGSISAFSANYEFTDCQQVNESKNVNNMFTGNNGKDITKYVIEGIDMDNGKLKQVKSYRFVSHNTDYYSDGMRRRDNKKRRVRSFRYKKDIKDLCENHAEVLKSVSL